MRLQKESLMDVPQARNPVSERLPPSGTGLVVSFLWRRRILFRPPVPHGCAATRLRTNRAKMVRFLGLVLALGALSPSQAQLRQTAPRSISRIEDQIKQHPDRPELYVTLGLTYWDQNDYTDALEAFQRAVRVGPASAEAHNWLGVATLERGDLSGAIAEFRKAISLDPKYARAYANLGSALVKNGELAKAITVFQQALSLEPNNMAAHMNLAVALREKGDAPGAIRHLRLVAGREPNNAKVQYLLGQTLQQSGDLGAAIAAFEAAVRIDPESRDGYYALGLALKQQAALTRKPNPPKPSPADELYNHAREAASRDNLKDAERLLNEALQKDAGHAEAQNLLGFILGQQGDLPSALAHLERAVSLRSDLADAHYNFGVALWYGGSKPKSISELQESVRLDPAAGHSYAFLGTALRETGQLDQARRNLQRAIGLLPAFAATYIDLGIVYLRAGDLEKALGQFEAGMSITPPSGPEPDWDTAIAVIRAGLATKTDNPEAHEILGLLLGRKGASSKEVLAELRQAVRLRPDSAEAHNNLGLVLAQDNEGQLAIAEFREALRIRPDYADAHANLGAALVSNDNEQAIQELEKAVALAPASLKAQFNLGVAYGASQSAGSKEIPQLRKVIATSPNFAPGRLALGKALLRDGKVQESIEQLQEAVRLDPQSAAGHYQLGLALARAGQKDPATAELQHSRELAASDDRKQNADLDIAEGRLALDDGALDQAAAKFRHALELQPDSSDAQHLLAVVLEKQGNAEGASTAYRKALELNPGDLAAREKIETLSDEKSTLDDFQLTHEFEGYIREGRFQEVEPLLAAYVKQRPKSSWAWYALGYALFAQRKIGPSIQALAKSLEMNTQNAEAHKILGRDLMIVGRFDAAQTEFEQGIRYNPQSAELHFNLGKLFSIQDNWVSARKEFEAAVRIDPSYVEGWDALGFAQEALADDAGAVASYEKAIALNEARKGNFVSAHVNLAGYYNRKRDPERALEYAHQALELDPKSDSAWFQQAKACEALGRLNDAADALNRAVSLNSRSSSYYYVLANVYRRLGKMEDSRKALDSFARLDKESNQFEEMRRSLANRPAVPSPKSRPD
jgi:tetratricopeptide (TPR) repeat protein